MYENTINTIQPNNTDLEKAGSKSRVHAIKLMVNCTTCDRRWNIYFEDMDDFLFNLPGNWHVCNFCNHSVGGAK